MTALTKQTRDYYRKLTDATIAVSPATHCARHGKLRRIKAAFGTVLWACQECGKTQERLANETDD